MLSPALISRLSYPTAQDHVSRAGVGAACRGLLKRFDRCVAGFLGGFESARGLG
jgi:hypothetical protein